MKSQSVLFVEKMHMLNQVIVLQIYYEYKFVINSYSIIIFFNILFSIRFYPNVFLQLVS